MSLKQFLDDISDWSHQDGTVPCIIYDNHVFVKRKRRKLVEAVGPYGFKEGHRLDFPVSDLGIFMDVRKLKKNVLYTIGVGKGLDIIEGYGVISGNLYGYPYTIDDVADILVKPNVRGLYFQNQRLGKAAFYETTDTP